MLCSLDEPEAWNRQCLTRKNELAKEKAAYDIRPRYHPVLETAGGNAQLEGTPETLRRSRPGQNPPPTQEIQISRNRSQSRRGQKRTNTGNTIDTGYNENRPTKESGSQRPQRTIMPSRRALEAINNNAQLIQWNSRQMDIEHGTQK
jgi:hypothetical protein